MRSLPRHMHWRKGYEADRYCRHLSKEDLEQRVRDIILNMMMLTDEGKIGFGDIEDSSTQLWWLRWTEVLHEMQLRYGPPPGGFTNGFLRRDPLPDLAGRLGKKAATALAKRRPDGAGAFMKYGKLAYMRPLLERGQLRIQPASYFASTSHNGAVRDDELSLAVSLVLSREDVAQLVANPYDVPQDAPDQTVEVSYSSPTDYWLYCVTTSVNARLFVDFQADACVMIHDQSAFTQRLIDAAESALPQSQSLVGKANYIDPHRPQSALGNVPLAKHFRYSYQQEHRFAWLPILPSQALSHVDVEIGSLRDIAELITFD